MRKLVFVFGALVALSLPSCIKDNHDDGKEHLYDTDSTQVVTDSVIEVTGIAIDGAMNSVSLVVGDDTVTFDYPDLDNDHRASWDINDTVTVRYYVTQSGDSVTDVINEADA